MPPHYSILSQDSCSISWGRSKTCRKSARTGCTGEEDELCTWLYPASSCPTGCTAVTRGKAAAAADDDDDDVDSSPVSYSILAPGRRLPLGTQAPASLHIITRAGAAAFSRLWSRGCRYYVRDAADQAAASQPHSCRAARLYARLETLESESVLRCRVAAGRSAILKVT